MAYQVGIDLGTTSTVAAVCRPGGAAHVVPLEGPTGAVASALYLGADGTVLVGEAAQRRALSDSGRVVRDLTRRIGDGTPLLVGREPVAAEDLAARFLARIVDDVARREGGVATRVAVTHPGSWGPHRIGVLRAALGSQGLGSALLVPEPVAAATGLGPGGAVGVYDLGGGRFEASVVGPTADGPELLAPLEAIERCGGADLDDIVFAHVRAALGAAWDALDPADPDVPAAVADLRRECTAAKEALSRDTEVLVPVALPGVRTSVRLGRAEFDDMIRSAVAGTVEAMRRAVASAPAEIAALVLVGGSSRIPLVPQLLGEAFGREVTVAADPVGAVATGAAVLAGARRVVVGRSGAGAAGSRAVGAVGAVGSVGSVGSVGAAGAVGVEGAAGAAAPGVSGASSSAAGAAGAVVPGVSGAAGAALGPAAAGTADHAGEPGTRPLRAGGDDTGDSPIGTTVLPVARPPKHARPFTANSEPPSRRGRVALLVSAGTLGLAVLGGVVAFGVGRIGAGSEAGAVTPASVVETGTTAPPTVTPAPTVAVAPPRPAAPATRRTRPAAPPSAPVSAPAVTAAPTKPPTSSPDRPQPAAPEKTGPPAGNGGGGTGGSNTGGEDAGGDNTGTDDGQGDGDAKGEAAAVPAAAPARDPAGGAAAGQATDPAGESGAAPAR